MLYLCWLNKTIVDDFQDLFTWKQTYHELTFTKFAHKCKNQVSVLVIKSFDLSNITISHRILIYIVYAILCTYKPHISCDILKEGWFTRLVFRYDLISINDLILINQTIKTRVRMVIYNWPNQSTNVTTCHLINRF